MLMDHCIVNNLHKSILLRHAKSFQDELENNTCQLLLKNLLRNPKNCMLIERMHVSCNLVMLVQNFPALKLAMKL